MKRILIIFVILSSVFLLSSYLESIYPGNTFSNTIEKEKKLYNNTSNFFEYMKIKLATL